MPVRWQNWLWEEWFYFLPRHSDIQQSVNVCELMNAEASAFLCPVVQHEQPFKKGAGAGLDEVSQRKQALAFRWHVIEERWLVGGNWRMTKLQENAQKNLVTECVFQCVSSIHSLNHGAFLHRGYKLWQQ